MKKIISILGPTGIGKTTIAIELAKKCNGEIIGVDSRQIYRGIPIGTAQPSKKQLSEIKHHLIGIKSLNEKISAGEYLNLIDSKISEILSRDKNPILCGGTGMYFNIILEGIFEGSHTNKEIRLKLENDYEKNKIKLYKKLQEVDPEYSKKVHINNKKRLVRALEIYETTGKTISQNFNSKNQMSKFSKNYYFTFLKMSKESLDIRLKMRVKKMVDEGMVDEVQKIKKKKIDISHIDYIGFREINEFLNQNISMDDCIENIYIRTRQYAKRQNKWFNSHTYNESFNLEKISINDIVDKLMQIN